MRNPVARHLRTFNRASVQTDRTKYTRQNHVNWLDEYEPPLVFILKNSLSYKF
ncbi:hypothetical protein VPHD51_0081 [Vibrio phage D51]